MSSGAQRTEAGATRRLFSKPASSLIEQAYGLHEEQVEFEDFYLVPVYRVTASSGHGAFPGREELAAPMAFPRKMLRRLASAGLDQLSIVFNSGDSNHPDIMDADAMLVDRAIERIVDDAYYVFAYDDALLVKKIERLLDGRVALKSRNPEYREDMLSTEDAAQLKVFGRVVWRGGLV